MNEMPEFEVINERVGFAGFSSILVYQLRHRLFDGEWSEVMEREIYHRAHAAAVILYDPVADAVVLVEQFRPAAAVSGCRPLQLEIAAGIIGKDESPEEVARREMIEETGCTDMSIFPIYNYFPSPGTSSDRTYLFCALINSTVLGGIHGVTEEGEHTKVTVVPFGRTMELLEEGRIENSTSIVAIQWLALNRDRLRAGGARP